MSEEGIKAKRKKKSEMVGVGCLLQLLGLLAPVVGFFMTVAIDGGITGGLLGLVALLVLFVVGSRKSIKYVCGHCGNPIAGSDVSICPVCKAELS